MILPNKEVDIKESVWTYVLRYKSFLTIFSLKTQQIEVRLVGITIDYFSPLAYTPFHFSRTLPLTNKNEFHNMEVNISGAMILTNKAVKMHLERVNIF